MLATGHARESCPERYTMLDTPIIQSLLLCVSAALIFAAGCGNANNGGDPRACNFNEDCAQPREYCDIVTSQCAAYECIEDEDCATGERCNTIINKCVDKPMTSPDMGMGNNATPDMQPSDNNPANNPTNNTTPSNTQQNNSAMSDTTPPSLTGVSPDPGSEIGPDTVFELTFSEPMDPISISEYTFFLENSLGQNIDLEVTYEEASNKAILTPERPLQSAGRYELIVKTFARDLAMNSLDRESKYDYFTPYEEPAQNAALAAKWAPIVYQGLASTSGNAWRRDFPVAIDFDGDWTANNNRARMESAPASNYTATVYYQVLESHSQLFIFYMTYYPARTLRDTGTGMDEQYEHDMTGAMFVIDKASDQLVLVEGLRVEQDTDTLIAFLRSGAGLSLPGEGRLKANFDPATLVDGRRYPLYIPGGRHEACNWHIDEIRQLSDACRHDAREFLADTGIKLLPGEQGGSVTGASTNGEGLLETTYKLRPFAEAFWVRRDSYGQEGLFDRGFSYSPKENRPKGPNEDSGLLIPRNLNSDDETSYGKTPFVWLVRAGDSNDGQWFLDPTWTVTRRYSIPDSITWSQDYCYHPFFEIDERGAQAACPNHEGAQ